MIMVSRGCSLSLLITLDSMCYVYIINILFKKNCDHSLTRIYEPCSLTLFTDSRSEALTVPPPTHTTPVKHIRHSVLYI